MGVRMTGMPEEIGYGWLGKADFLELEELRKNQRSDFRWRMAMPVENPFRRMRNGAGGTPALP